MSRFSVTWVSRLSRLSVGYAAFGRSYGAVPKRTTAGLAELGIGLEISELQRIVVRETVTILSDHLGLS